ncbi:unnamed protein product [Allacma fusca]|uniref:Uncharacterized protein n=1 Tax=Allacma fusca TaxID=39272 RepID=A0A8J2PWC8_9HEXA|nr:unnamed protein product [Allacma fusca]
MANSNEVSSKADGPRSSEGEKSIQGSAGEKQKSIPDKKDPVKGPNENKEVVQGGLQINRQDAVEEASGQINTSDMLIQRPSKFRVGGITDALLEIPPSITQKLTPAKVIHADEPVYPTESRIGRIKEKNANDSFGKRFNRKMARFDLWALQTIPDGYVLAYNIAFTLAPILFLLTLWDLLGVTVFMIPHFTTFNRPGVLYPFYPIGTVLSFYGYMMRFLMEDVSRETTISLAGVFVYPFLLVIRCCAHYFFNGYRDETKLWY